MKILWVSDAPMGRSAYANQTALITPKLTAMGHEVVIFAGQYTGAPLVINGIKVVGGRDAAYGPPLSEDMINDHADAHGSEIVITLKDPYAFTPEIMAQLRYAWYPVVPIPAMGLPTMTEGTLRYCTQPIAVTHHGEKILAERGYKPVYIPHAYDPAIFRPGNQETARKQRGIDPDAFVALFVGDNNSYPSRKNIDQILAAWASFVQVHPDAVLILHTYMLDDRGGIDIGAYLNAYGIQARNIQITQPYAYEKNLPPDYVAGLYRCADVLVNIGNEGFGLPTLEAQACGTPVIGIEWAATTEIVRYGEVISGGGDGDLWMDRFGVMNYRPHISAVAEALLRAYKKKRGNKVTSMEDYSLNNVMPRWQIWLDRIRDIHNGVIDGTTDGDAGISGVDADNRRLPSRTPADDRGAGQREAGGVVGTPISHAGSQRRSRRGRGEGQEASPRSGRSRRRRF